MDTNNTNRVVKYDDQHLAMSCNIGFFDLRDGFYSHCDVGAIDAPDFLPSGSTRESEHQETRYVFGGIVYRANS